MFSSTALLASIMGLGAPELLIVLVILLILFGGAKLPSLAKGIGQSIKEFKKASKDEQPAEVEAATPAEVKKTETPATPQTPVRNGTN